jgi:arginase
MSAWLARCENRAVPAVCLIQVPYMVGNDAHPAAAGPARVAQRLPGLRTVVVERGEPFRDSVYASRLVNTELAAAVRDARERGELPIVVAGACDASMGAVGGIPHARTGIVWIDAHGDFNTPESSTSGFFGGMSVAVLTGECYRAVWAEVGDSTPIREDRVVLVGIRDLSPEAERDRLGRSAVEVVPPGGDVEDAIARLLERVDDVYLHVDLDGLDPEIAPGIVDPPVPGGLTLEELERVIRALEGRLAAVSITTFVPEWDRDDRTLGAVLRAIELISGRAPG